MSSNHDSSSEAEKSKIASSGGRERAAGTIMQGTLIGDW